MLSLLKVYAKIGVFGFCTTFTSNLTHNLIFNYKRRYTHPHINEAIVNIYKHPVAFLLKNMDKSFKFGIAWPYIPYILYKNPHRFYNICGEYHYKCSGNCILCGEIKWSSYK